MRKPVSWSLPGISPALTPVIVLVEVFVLENLFSIHDLLFTNHVFHIPSREWCIGVNKWCMIEEFIFDGSLRSIEGNYRCPRFYGAIFHCLSEASRKIESIITCSGGQYDGRREKINSSILVSFFFGKLGYRLFNFLTSSMPSRA